MLATVKTQHMIENSRGKRFLPPLEIWEEHRRYAKSEFGGDNGFFARSLVEGALFISPADNEGILSIQDSEERIGAWIAREEARKIIEIEGSNDITILGLPAAGKSTLIKDLLNRFDFAPTVARENMEIVGADSLAWHDEFNHAMRSHRTFAEAETEQYIVSRIRYITRLMRGIHTQDSGKYFEHIIIGGIIQTLSTLAAYFSLYEESFTMNGKIKEIPDQWVKIVALFPIYSRRFIFVDAPKDVRVNRAREHAIRSGDPRQLTKRETAFKFDSRLRELTINFLQKIKAYRGTLGKDTYLYYYPTADMGEDYKSPEGFIEIGTNDITSLERGLMASWNNAKMYESFRKQERIMGSW